jgi:hypothetical protein
VSLDEEWALRFLVIDSTRKGASGWKCALLDRSSELLVAAGSFVLEAGTTGDALSDGELVTPPQPMARTVNMDMDEYLIIAAS